MQIEALGDRALLLRFGERIDAGVNSRVLSVAARIDANRPPWLRDCVPAYASLAIFIDESESLPVAEAWLRRLIESTSATATVAAGHVVEIPVRYGGMDGPDLEVVAAELQMSPEELIARHCAPTYRVAMLGFAPGFPYLIGLDSKLHAPRLATPRSVVPAGSVGIGGSQTGIYPCASPGGWRLIGQTDASLFDAHRTPPSLLIAGDHVRFVAV